MATLSPRVDDTVGEMGAEDVELGGSGATAWPNSVVFRSKSAVAFTPLPRHTAHWRSKKLPSEVLVKS